MKVGHGLVAWLPTDDYLSADETRALGETVYRGYRCLFAFLRHPETPSPYKLERAHIVRRMAGGRHDTLSTGPQVLLCRNCHTWLDSTRYATLAVGRADQAVYLLELVEDADGDVFDRGSFYRIEARKIG